MRHSIEQPINWLELEQQAKQDGWNFSPDSTRRSRKYTLTPSLGIGRETSGTLEIVDTEGQAFGVLVTSYKTTSPRGIVAENIKILGLPRSGTRASVESRVSEFGGHSDAVEVGFTDSGEIEQVKTTLPPTVADAQKPEVAHSLFRRVIPQTKDNIPLNLHLTSASWITAVTDGQSPTSKLIFTTKA